MKRLFHKVSNEICNLSLAELSQYLTASSAKRFYARAGAIHLLYTTGKYKEKFNSVQEWAEEEFGWNRKQVERYRDAYDLLIKLDHVSNWTHLPINELQCRALASFDFDTKELREAWRVVDKAVCEGARLTGKLIEQVCSAKIDNLQLEEPEQYEAVMRQISPQSAEYSEETSLDYRPEINFCPSVLDWKERPHACLPGFVPQHKVLVVNARGFEEICQWAAERMDLNFFVLADFPQEYEEKEMPPNVWPGAVATSQDDFEKALHVFSNTWSPKKWLWVNLREPVHSVQINADWVAVKEFYNLASLGEILRDTQEVYFMPGAIEKHNRPPEKTFGFLKVFV